MKNEELQSISDFFLKKLFYGIPSIPCRFADIDEDTSGCFCLEENENCHIDEELEEELEKAPEYKVQNIRDEDTGFGIDIIEEHIWTDPLKKPILYININSNIRRRKMTVIGVLLHELTHYYCWYCGYDRFDGSPQFESELKKRNLPSNGDSVFKNGQWKDTFNYSTMSVYYDMYKQYLETGEI